MIPLEHATVSDVMFSGALASQEANQNPIDPAFRAAVRERHIFDTAPVFTAVSLAPFDAKQTSVIGYGLSWILVQTFLAAQFSGAERHRHRLAKIAELESGEPRT
jgi:hypothetical protein